MDVVPHPRERKKKSLKNVCLPGVGAERETRENCVFLKVGNLIRSDQSSNCMSYNCMTVREKGTHAS